MALAGRLNPGNFTEVGFGLVVVWREFCRQIEDTTAPAPVLAALSRLRHRGYTSKERLRPGGVRAYNGMPEQPADEAGGVAAPVETVEPTDELKRPVEGRRLSYSRGKQLAAIDVTHHGAELDKPTDVAPARVHGRLCVRSGRPCGQASS
jgi:hypothetical protein